LGGFSGIGGISLKRKLLNFEKSKQTNNLKTVK